MSIKYCTVEDVKLALPGNASAYADSRILRAIESASRAVDGQMNRKFYPQVATHYYDWPNYQYASSQTLWFEDDEVLSVTSLVSGGVTIPSNHYFLEPNVTGPPYDRVVIDLSTSSSFSSGNTYQRAISVTGVFGYGNDTEAAGSTSEVLDASETGVDVTDSALIGTGDTILVDSEYMTVNSRSMLSTGVTIAGADSLTAQTNDQSITVSSTVGMPTVGETILIDSERMLVLDVAGFVLSVKRAWDGSTLAAHAALATIYAPRTLNVTRGVLGTTAATHLISAPVSRHAVPGLIRDLTIAEAIVRFSQESASYARSIGGGDNARNASLAGLADLRDQAQGEYARQGRMRSV